MAKKLRTKVRTAHTVPTLTKATSEQAARELLERGDVLKRTTTHTSIDLASSILTQRKRGVYEPTSQENLHGLGRILPALDPNDLSSDPADENDPLQDRALPPPKLQEANNILTRISKLIGLDSELMDDEELVSWWERAGKYMGGKERRDSLMAARGWSWEKLKAQQERLKSASEWLLTLNEEEAKWVADLIDHIIKCAREFVIPPDSKSVANFELEAMNLAYLMYPIWTRPDTVDKSVIEPQIADLVMSLRQRYPAINKIWKRATDILERIDPKSKGGARGQAFTAKWMESSFARLEVSHKLCASLCLTDVPEELEVKAPWEAWSLIVPDGVIWPGNKPVRVWVYQTDPIAVLSDGSFLKFPDVSTKELREKVKDNSSREARTTEMLINLIRGACLALSNPDDFSKQRAGEGWKSSKKSSRKGPPELSQARFLLSAPVTVDLREEVRRVVSGERKGSSPKVQFLVRGHWRNQVHGPKRSLRKTIWIQPFWKGDEEARVLLRHTEIKSDPKG